jgi:glutamate racemase
VKLGILDWGIGGVGFYALARARWPRLPVVYWSDAGTIPYGKQAPAELARRLVAVARWLKREAGVTHLAIACNAASSVLPTIDLRDETLPRITGVIEHAVRAALQRTAPGRSSASSAGGAPSSPARTRRALAGRTVLQRVAQPILRPRRGGRFELRRFAPRAGRHHGAFARVDLLVLACTHYPALRGAFAQRAPGAGIVDPAAELLAWAVDAWQLDSAGSGSEPDRVLTTGDVEAMARSSRLAFGMELRPVSISI